MSSSPPPPPPAARGGRPDRHAVGLNTATGAAAVIVIGIAALAVNRAYAPGTVSALEGGRVWSPEFSAALWGIGWGLIAIGIVMAACGVATILGRR